MKKGQLSVEHLVIVGLSLMVILPSTYLLLNFANNTSDLLISQQIKSVGDVIIFYGRDMYLRGEGNYISMTVVLPDTVKNMSVVSGSELVINYRTVKGPNEAVFFTDYPLVGATGSSNELVVDRAGLVNLAINMTSNGVVIKER